MGGQKRDQVLKPFLPGLILHDKENLSVNPKTTTGNLEMEEAAEHKFKVPVEIAEAIEEYNRYRSPEAIAEIIDYKDKDLTVRFAGSFCFTCGINDWIEDLKYVLEDHGVEAEIIEIIEENETGRVAKFRVRKIALGKR